MGGFCSRKVKYNVIFGWLQASFANVQIEKKMFKLTTVLSCNTLFIFLRKVKSSYATVKLVDTYLVR